ncbi:hypothetical protein, partial [Sphingorhabdus sp.]|uniref:hypothetical protein n=1 Tax=Sphingorhabdus sp. TaxID=1902408 RepID=UPI003C70C3C3
DGTQSGRRILFALIQPHRKFQEAASAASFFVYTERPFVEIDDQFVATLQQSNDNIMQNCVTFICQQALASYLSLSH